MLQRKIIVLNQSELIELQENLDYLKIPHSSLNIQDSSFPSSNSNLEYAAIIPEHHSQSFFRAQDHEYHTQILNPPISSKRTGLPRWLFAVLTIFTLFVTAYCLKLQHLANHSSEVSKNFNYGWNVTGTALISRHQFRPDSYSISHDSNYDLNFERMEEFEADKLISLFLDNDEDGFYEKSYIYGNDGGLSHSWSDDDKNNWFERSEVILENKDTLVLIDPDNNGYYEIVKD